MPIFLAPWFLLATAVAAVPVALHLLHRRRPKPVPFSSLRFLMEATAKTRRSRHLTNFLTLLMRVLIILLLALSFSMPKVRFATWLPEGKRTVVLVLDGSVSMQCRDADKSCFDQARDWALNLVRSLEERDAVAVLVPGLDEPRVIFPAISDHDAVVRALEDARPGHNTIELVEVLNDLFARLPSGRERVGLEIHVFSDFQKSNCDLTGLEGVNREVSDSDVLLFLNHVRPPVMANAGIAKAAFYPPAILGDGEFQANATIRSSADFSGGNTLRLVIGDEEQAQRVFPLLPSQTVTEGLAGHAAGDADLVHGQLQLEADGFAPDNVYRFCLPRIAGIPVLLVDGSARGSEGSRDTFFLNHAIQPKGKARTLFLPTIADWATFLSSDPNDYSIVFLCNPPALGQEVFSKLEDYVRGGGTAVFMPGQHNALEEGLAQFPPLRGLKVEKNEMVEGKSVSIVASPTPAELEKRLLGVMPPPAALVVRRRLTFRDLPGNAKTVFQFAGGGPFLFEVPVGQGAFWGCSVSANRDWSEWPLTPFFVVLQQELIKSCARRSLSSLTTTVGGALPVEWAAVETELDFRVRSPSGRERTVSLKRTDASKPAVFSCFEEPGFYRVSRDDKERIVAVNIPQQECDLTYLTPDELSMPLRSSLVKQSDSWHAQQQSLADLHHGRPLWPFLLCVAFVIAVTEEVFANVRSKTLGFSDSLKQFMKSGGRSR